MAIRRRLAALLAGIAGFGVLASCAYDDSSPPTGEGRPYGFLLFLVLLVAALILAGGLAWFHLRASPIIGGRPGLVWVAVSWCFVSAAVVAVPGMALVLAFASEAVNGSDNRGDERLLVDFGWILASVGAISLCLGLAMVSLGLSVRRGAPWSRWVTAIISSLVSLNFVGLAAKQLAQEDGPSGIALLLLVLPAALPLPFLFWFGGRFHFAPERVALPVPPPPPERFPEAPALSDRWHSRR